MVVASVLGGAAIGNVLDSNGTTDTPPATVDDVAEPAAAFTCDENYASCVPVATDVVGNDVYELDADHDGIGCD
jgi:hypothetical protein